MLSSAQPLNHIYVTMSKQACNTCTLWVQGSSILIKDDGTGTDTENKRYRQQKLLVILQPHDGWGLRKNSIKFLRGDSFIVRASCSADPDKRVHSISVMDVISSLCVCVCVCVCVGGANDPCPRPAPAGVWGSGCKLLHRV